MPVAVVPMRSKPTQVPTNIQPQQQHLQRQFKSRTHHCIFCVEQERGQRLG
jgi:hypothetical protein